jgi:hypothetical protein
VCWKALYKKRASYGIFFIRRKTTDIWADRAAFAEDFQKRSQKKGKEVDRLKEERI